MVATHNRPDTQPIYELHRRWLTEVLPDGDSLLTPGTAVWTAANLDELERQFVGRPDLTKDKKFLEKLRDQLSGCSPLAVQLMAELHIVHFLHVFTGAISVAKKKADIETILSWMPVPPPVPTEVAAALGPGMIHPGQWVLSRRDTQLTWLIHFSRAWLRLEASEQQRLATDAWAFKDLIDGVEAPSADSARLAMLHLSHPDVIEPITSADHKALIAARFSSLAGDNADVDRQLVAIRKALEPEYGSGFDWYLHDLDRRWSRNAKAWKALLIWVRRIRELPGFDEDERDYKLRFVPAIAAARELALASERQWPEALRKAFTHADNNVTRWTVHDRFLRWVNKDSSAAHGALLALWADAGPAWERMDRFAAAVPADVLSNRGERLNLGSFLLMAEDALGLPPIKVQALRRSFKLVGWPRDTDSMTDGEAYRRGLLLFEEVFHEGKDWPTPLRDPLDAQGALWALLNAERPPASWPEAWWSDLLAYRTTSVDPGDPVEGEGEAEYEGSPEGEGPVINGEVAENAVDHIEQAAKDLHVDRRHLDEIVQLLEDKSQVVLYGPPGTGKTYLALRMARAIAKGYESRISLVQFHPATSYEDFIEGLRPTLTDGGQVTYQVVPGPLVRIAEAARQDPTHTYVLVVDEINRANLPKVFGELLFLLEYRKERARTIHRPDEPFGLPANLWMIGTMNTADQSIALIDAAMRRRFHFVPFFPHTGAMKGLLRRWLHAKGGRVVVADLLDAVNTELEARLGDHLLLGPSHFMKNDLSDASLERIWTYNIFPLIEEQFWGDRATIDRWRWPAVRARFATELGEALPDDDVDATSTGEVPAGQPNDEALPDLDDP